jgi:hypothetical protein
VVDPGTRRRVRTERGQVAVLLVGGLLAVLVGAFVPGAVAQGVGGQAAAQRAADLGRWRGARAIRAEYARLFEPPALRRRANPQHLEKAAYLEIGRTAAVRVARANDAPNADVAFPDGRTFAPVRIRVAVRRRFAFGGRRLALRASAEAELCAAGTERPGGRWRLRRAAGIPAGQADAARRGAGVRPDGPGGARRRRVARDLERVSLRCRAGRAVRPPSGPEVGRAAGRVAAPQRHRARPRAALGLPWLAANAGRFHFRQRYEWEDWH